MKKPQLEDGFTRIANELFEAILGYGFTQRQLVVVLAILRKTYGYGKKEDDMSASQVGEVCNMSRNHVTEVIGQLAKMNVLTKRQGHFGMILGVNKSYKEWGADSPKLGLVPNQDSPKLGLGKVVPIRDATSPNLGQVDSPNLGHTKENLPKETQKKARSRKPRPDVTFDEWIENLKAKDEKPVPEDDSIFDYAEEVKLPIDYVRYCWLEFKRKYSNSDKEYKDWRAAFRNSVRENWYSLWFDKDDQWHLTTRGIQIQKEMRVKNENK